MSPQEKVSNALEAWRGPGSQRELVTLKLQRALENERRLEADEPYLGTPRVQAFDVARALLDAIAAEPNVELVAVVRDPGKARR